MNDGKKKSRRTTGSWCGVVAVWLAATAQGQYIPVLPARQYGDYRVIRVAAYRNDTLTPVSTRLTNNRFISLTRTSAAGYVAMTFRKGRRSSLAPSFTYPSCQLIKTIAGYDVYDGADRLGTLVGDTLTLEDVIQDVVTGVIYRNRQIAVRSPRSRTSAGTKSPHVNRG